MESVNKLEIIYELVTICIFEQVMRMLQVFINDTMICVRASEKFTYFCVYRNISKDLVFDISLCAALHSHRVQKLIPSPSSLTSPP